MEAVSLSTSLEFSLRVKDQNGQLFKMQVNPQNLGKTKASPLYSKEQKAIKVKFNNFYDSNDTQKISRLFLGMTTDSLKCVLLPSELNLKLDSSNHSVIKTKIDLIAKTTDGFYRIRIKPDNLSGCFAKFYPYATQQKRIVSVRVSDDLSKTDPMQLRTHLAQGLIAACNEKSGGVVLF
jgi:hypothetical protein